MSSNCLPIARVSTPVRSSTVAHVAMPFTLLMRELHLAPSHVRVSCEAYTATVTRSCSAFLLLCVIAPALLVLRVTGF